MSDLAIVIPAFKGMYFEKALLSVANQTCKEFTLYIGNDSSPFDLKSSVDRFKDRIDIVYKEFNENLGGKDLVAHWERCIDLVYKENWIWLFSDDDLMDTTCVENFYITLNQNPKFDLFHFNVSQIDESDNIIGNLHPFPDVLTAEEFLDGKLKIGEYSTVVEYIFRKSCFYDQHRFQNFDLAWCSDDATWIKLGMKMGIKNIDDAKVYWRTSPFNISANYWDKDVLIRKYYSQIEFASWILNEVSENKYRIDIIQLQNKLKVWYFGTIKSRIDFLSFKIIAVLTSKFYLTLYEHSSPVQKVVSLYAYKIFQTFKRLLKAVIFWNYLKTLKPKGQFLLSSIFFQF
jgi:hypothetical protein